MRNRPYIYSGKGLRMMLVVLLRGPSCFHNFLHGSSRHPRSFSSMIFSTCNTIYPYTIPQSSRTALHHASLLGYDTVLNLLLKTPNCPINDQDQVCNKR